MKDSYTWTHEESKVAEEKLRALGLNNRADAAKYNVRGLNIIIGMYEYINMTADEFFEKLKHKIESIEIRGRSNKVAMANEVREAFIEEVRKCVYHERNVLGLRGYPEDAPLFLCAIVENVMGKDRAEWWIDHSELTSIADEGCYEFMYQLREAMEHNRHFDMYDIDCYDDIECDSIFTLDWMEYFLEED